MTRRGASAAAPEVDRRRRSNRRCKALRDEEAAAAVASISAHRAAVDEPVLPVQEFAWFMSLEKDPSGNGGTCDDCQGLGLCCPFDSIHDMANYTAFISEDLLSEAVALGLDCPPAPAPPQPAVVGGGGGGGRQWVMDVDVVDVLKTAGQPPEPIPTVPKRRRNPRPKVRRDTWRSLGSLIDLDGRHEKHNVSSSARGRGVGEDDRGQRGRRVGRECFQCHTTETPQWRAGPAGAGTLCNACGLRFKHRGGGVKLVQPRARSSVRRRRQAGTAESEVVGEAAAATAAALEQQRALQLI